MLGAELLLQSLEANGVDTVFGLPGGAVIPLYDVIWKSGIKHILMRHEQGAAHAADGYARATGKVGVCFATSGPGATNLLTGLATANMDSVPIVAITGQVAEILLGKDSFQEADVLGLSTPVTKHSYMVKSVNEIPDIIAEAFHIATSGRPGPVMIDIPKNFFTEEVLNPRPGKVRERLLRKFAAPRIKEDWVKTVAHDLQRAERPLILTGGGVNNVRAAETLSRIVDKFEIPVATTLMGKGAYIGKKDLFLGLTGMHGTPQANWAIQNADYVLALGTRFSDRLTGLPDCFASQAKVVQVDIDSAEIGKNIIVHQSVVAEGDEFLKILEDNLWAMQMDKRWLQELRERSILPSQGRTKLLDPRAVLEKLNSLVDEDTIIVTDVGQHQMWSALFVHPERPNRFLTSGGLGTMGYGLPAAIGAQIANPDKRVVLVTGDGSFQMCLQELAVIKKFGLPIKILLFNNGYLGMVRQWQELFFSENYAETCLDVGPDWQTLAEAYAIESKIAESQADYEKILNGIWDNGKPFLFDLRIDPGANVYPIVPAGSGLDEMWGCSNNETYASSDG